MQFKISQQLIFKSVDQFYNYLIYKSGLLMCLKFQVATISFTAPII